MKKFLFFFCLTITQQLILAQLTDAENIKTVVFRPAATNTYTPFIKLGEELKLSFDDLNADEQEYYYKITHCEFNWTPSKLIDSEFVNGFAKDRIRDFNNSFNTLMPYTNYQLTIPNQYTRFKISGNYLITIYNEDDEIAFQRKFIIYEPKVTVAVGVHKSRDISKLDTHQSVQFTINNGSFRINNPSQEIMPVILQNNNWQTAITNIKPQYIRGSQLIYKYDNETSYWGGNEFLYFDSKSLRNATINISTSILEDDIYNTYLFTDEERIDQPYTLFEDINGNFITRALFTDYPNIEADYTRVFFSLASFEKLKGKEIFVSGNFNNWQLTDLNKLKYNSNSGLYQTNFVMKQGFYNYQYLTRDAQGNISIYDIDGSHYETENDYTVLVYYKKFGARYTKVIGVGFGSSKVILN